MSLGFCPEIVYACSLTTFRPWRGEPGALLLLRTTPFPRTCGPVRLSVRVALCGDRRAPKRFTLRPEQVDEEGLILVRLPKRPTRALLAIRLCVGPFAGPKRMVLVSGGASGL